MNIPNTRMYMCIIQALKEHTNITQEQMDQNLIKWPKDEDWLRYNIKQNYPKESKQILKRAQEIKKDKDQADQRAEQWTQRERYLRNVDEYEQAIKNKVHAGKYKDAREDLADHLILKHQLITLEGEGQIYYHTKGVYKPTPDDFLKKEVQKIWHKPTKWQVNEVIDCIKRKTYKSKERIQAPPYLLCLENGVYNIHTQHFSKHDQKYYFFQKLPVRWVFNADQTKWKQFLKEVVSQEDAKILQEFIGYCLLRTHKYHKGIMLLGEGANGKSVFLNTIIEFLGKENVTGISLQEMENNRFSIASLKDKMANIYCDLSPKALEDTGKFKLLTGQDTLMIEKKYKDAEQFSNTAKMLFSANNLPPVKDVSKGLFRRWIIIKFPNDFSKNPNENLIHELTTPECLQGILLWALEGLERLEKQRKFSESKSTEETKRMYLRLSNPIMAFIMDKLEYNAQEYTPKWIIYEEYEKYCTKMQLYCENTSVFWRNARYFMPHGVRVQRKSYEGNMEDCIVGMVIKDKKQIEITEEEII